MASYICYKKYNPGARAKELINLCNDVLEEYSNQGYTLTLRQLYYQLVARDHIPNNISSYTRLGNIVGSARDAGLISWDYIEDRGRVVQRHSSWKTAGEFMKSASRAFHLDWWDKQPIRCFVLVEKDALAEVVGRAADRYDVPYLACRGYPSASVLWNMARLQMLKKDDGCYHYRVIHLGDHDPSGIDMTRDLQERLELYALPTDKDEEEHTSIVVERIALNYDQVEQYNPPPNPAKKTDTRFVKYMEEFGLSDSWELDALEPGIIESLIEDKIEEIIQDKKRFNKIQAQERSIQKKLAKVTV